MRSWLRNTKVCDQLQIDNDQSRSSLHAHGVQKACVTNVFYEIRFIQLVKLNFVYIFVYINYIKRPL